jgi:hypothetical protein
MEQKRNKANYLFLLFFDCVLNRRRFAFLRRKFLVILYLYFASLLVN